MFITHPPASSNVYQNINFYFKKTKKTKRPKVKEIKEEKRISLEKLRGYDDIACEFALCSCEFAFNLLDRIVNFSCLVIQI